MPEWLEFPAPPAQIGVGRIEDTRQGARPGWFGVVAKVVTHDRAELTGFGDRLSRESTRRSGRGVKRGGPVVRPACETAGQ